MDHADFESRLADAPSSAPQVDREDDILPSSRRTRVGPPPLPQPFPPYSVNTVSQAQSTGQYSWDHPLELQSLDGTSHKSTKQGMTGNYLRQSEQWDRAGDLRPRNQSESDFSDSESFEKTSVAKIENKSSLKGLPHNTSLFRGRRDKTSRFYPRPADEGRSSYRGDDVEPYDARYYSRFAQLASFPRPEKGLRIKDSETSVSSTISKDNTAGEHARHASLFAQYGTKVQQKLQIDDNPLISRSSRSHVPSSSDSVDKLIADFGGMPFMEPSETTDMLDDFDFYSFLRDEDGKPPFDFNGAFNHMDDDEIGRHRSPSVFLPKDEDFEKL